MSKKEINIDREVIKSACLALVLAFVIVFIVEHFSSFSYVPDTSNIPMVTPDGKIYSSTSFYPSSTKVARLTQTTPFGTEINLSTNGMMCSELLFEGTAFKSYQNKIQLYFNAVFKDFKYLLMIWGVLTLILLFFKKYNIKLTTFN